MPRLVIPPLIAAALLLAGCVQLRPSDGARPPTADVGTVERPRTDATTGAASNAGSSAGAVPLSSGAPLGTPERPLAPAAPLAGVEPGAGQSKAQSEADPLLRRTVAERCANRASDRTELSMLRGLVAELAADGVEPADAVDALILGRCGDLADIVTEVVAYGGESAAMPVIDRAVAIAGPSSLLVIERAATEGLMLAGRERVSPRGYVGASAATAGRSELVAQFPPGVARAAAEPGYALYTFVLPGDPAAGSAAGDRLAATRELLRVIESYVLAEGDARGHSFVVPVSAERADGTLVERTGMDAAAAMRNRLTGYLRRTGQGGVAARLATSPGPFLVSTLEPRLVPLDPQAARMLVDLSAVGPEYMYNVVDAYDRPVPSEVAGRADSLRALRGRLTGLLSEAGAGAAPADWVFMLGQRSLTGAGGGLGRAPRLASIARGG